MFRNTSGLVIRIESCDIYSFLIVKLNEIKNQHFIWSFIPHSANVAETSKWSEGSSSDGNGPGSWSRVGNRPTSMTRQWGERKM